MQFSAKLINRLRRVRFTTTKSTTTCPQQEDYIDCNSLQVGGIILDLAEDLVVFLRCATDYKDNQKQIDDNERTGRYAHYRKVNKA